MERGTGGQFWVGQGRIASSWAWPDGDGELGIIPGGDREHGILDAADVGWLHRLGCGVAMA
jgi:hypothetical protein